MTLAFVVRPVVSAAPITSRPLKDTVAAAAWWPLHQKAGDVSVACALGRGAPALALAGAENAIWTANWGCATPDGSAHRLQAPTADAYIQSLLRLDTLAGGEILFGWEIAHDGDITANETLWSWGRPQSTAGCRGQYAMRLNSSESWFMSTTAGEGNGGTINSTLSGTGTTGITAIQQCVLSITAYSGSNFTFAIYRNVVGTGQQTPRSVQVDLLQNGGYLPSGDASSIFSVFARQSAAAPTWDTPMGAAAGSNARVNNLWIARLFQADSAAAQACLDSMTLEPREFPRYLRKLA